MEQPLTRRGQAAKLFHASRDLRRRLLLDKLSSEADLSEPNLSVPEEGEVEVISRREMKLLLHGKTVFDSTLAIIDEAVERVALSERGEEGSQGYMTFRLVTELASMVEEARHAAAKR